MAYALSRHEHLITSSKPVSLWKRLRLWLAMREERAALAKLDARMLADIGLDESAVQREVHRTVWDIPNHRWHG